MLNLGTLNYSKIVIVDSEESITSNTKEILWLMWSRTHTNKQNVICLTEYVETNDEFMQNTYLEYFDKIYRENFSKISISDYLMRSKLYECSFMTSGNFDNRIKLMAVNQIRKSLANPKIKIESRIAKYDIDKELQNIHLNKINNIPRIFLLMCLNILESYLYVFKLLLRRVPNNKSASRERKKLDITSNNIVFIGYGAHYIDESINTKYWAGLSEVLDGTNLNPLWVDLHINNETRREKYKSEQNKLLLDVFISRWETFSILFSVTYNFFALSLLLLTRQYKLVGFWLDKEIIKSILGKQATEGKILENCFTNLFNLFHNKSVNVIYLMEGQAWERTLNRLFRQNTSEGSYIAGYVHAAAFNWDLRFKAASYFDQEKFLPLHILVNNSISKFTLSNLYPHSTCIEVEALRSQLTKKKISNRCLTGSNKVLISGDYSGLELRCWIKLINDGLVNGCFNDIEFTIREHPLTPRPIDKRDTLFESKYSVAQKCCYENYNIHLVSSTSSVTFDLLRDGFKIANIVTQEQIYKSITNGKYINICSNYNDLNDFFDFSPTMGGNFVQIELQYMSREFIKWRSFIGKL
jgi:hypothetical protein